MSLSLTDDEWSRFDGVDDLESSLIARLGEVYDRNGDPITPRVTRVELDED